MGNRSQSRAGQAAIFRSAIMTWWGASNTSRTRVHQVERLPAMRTTITSSRNGRSRADGCPAARPGHRAAAGDIDLLLVNT